MFEQDVAVLVQCTRLLAARMDDLEELLEESRFLECELPVVFVDIEHASLRSRICRSFCFVNCRSNPVYVKDARKRQPAEPGADDRD
jgi:hypothetical protein